MTDDPKDRPPRRPRPLKSAMPNKHTIRPNLDRYDDVRWELIRGLSQEAPCATN
jgi:hypothetical protein